MLADLIHNSLVYSLIGLLGWAGLSDALTMTIPNRVTAAIVLLYIAWVAVRWPEVNPIGGVATGAIVLAIGFAVFAAGLIGGGDVKLLAAVSLWAGASRIFEVLIVIALVGGAVAIAILVILTLRRHAFTIRGTGIDQDVPIARRTIPYGVAIAMGGVHLALRLML